MKSIIICCAICLLTLKGSAQKQEIQQLLLDVEKLAQFKQVLSNLKKGYQIVTAGYNNIKNISEGNFSLHKAFLDGLLQVSPAVKKYTKIKDIMRMQSQLVAEYKHAYSRFKSNNAFTVKELEHMGETYSNLFNKSLQNLELLISVLTANTYRMSDEERLSAIDHIYADMQDKLVFLRHFNSGNTVLAIQRTKEQGDVDVMRRLYRGR